MILSSVNFVNTNHQFTDFILGKICEEQNGVSPAIKGIEKESPTHLSHKTTEATEPGIDDLNKQIDAAATEEQTRKDLVAIETSDGLYYLTFDKTTTSVSLKSANHFTDSSPSGTFRRRSLGAKESPSGSPCNIVAFQVEEAPMLFLTTTNDRQLQVQMCDTELDETVPDERFFVIHHLKNEEDVFLQPYAHKGYYLHHLDSEVSLRQLDVNWRPPEEYYFRLAELTELEDTASCLFYNSLEQTYGSPKISDSRKKTIKAESDIFINLNAKKTSRAAKSEKHYSGKSHGLFSACFQWLGTGNAKKSSEGHHSQRKTQLK